MDAGTPRGGDNVVDPTAPRGGTRRLALILALVSSAALSQTRSAGEESSTVKIMPLGDSITEGYDGQATYRYFLWHMLVDGPCDVDFVGSRRGVVDGEPLYADFDQDHEGHCGWASAEVLFELEGWVVSARPDVVLIHLGTNDLAYGLSTEDITRDLGAIIDVIRAHRPRAAVLLAQIIPSTWGQAVIRALNEEIAVLGAEKNTDESPVVVVDQWTGFSLTEDTCDGLHPNERGERKIAAKWYEALKGVLPEPPEPPGPPGPGGLAEGKGCGTDGGAAALVAVVPFAALLARLGRRARERGRGRWMGRGTGSREETREHRGSTHT